MSLNPIMSFFSKRTLFILYFTCCYLTREGPNGSFRNWSNCSGVRGRCYFIIAYLCNYRAEENLKQNNIANSLVRAIERDKLNYMQMDESMAKLIAKAQSSYTNLKGYEKVQFDAFVLQKMSIYVRSYRFAEESAFKFGTSRLRNRIKINTSEFFSRIGVRECYESLLERNLINDQPLLSEIVDDLT